MSSYIPNHSFAEEVIPANENTYHDEVIKESAPAEVETKEIPDTTLTNGETIIQESKEENEILVDNDIEGDNSSNEKNVIFQVPTTNSSNQKSISPTVANPISTVPQFLKSDTFFEVIEQLVPIYDNSSGSLIQVGYLNEGQVYPRFADYGDWHQIKFGSGYGYVWDASTKPAPQGSINNLNATLENIDLYFKANINLPVYDNNTGSLVPFATIIKDAQYPVLSDFSDWYQIDVSGRIGYIYKGGVEIVAESTIFGKVIVLDAGHGGSDRAMGSKIQKKH